jgi:hypothetical protein
VNQKAMAQAETAAAIAPQLLELHRRRIARQAANLLPV